MKQQFKFHPLATAIVTLVCGGTLTNYAVANVTPSNLTNEELKTAIAEKELYPGQRFFDQYYVDKTAPEAQQRSAMALSSAYCKGTWITPIPSDQKLNDITQESSEITADYGYYNPNNYSTLEGNVIISQNGRQIRAEKITIDKTQTFANAQGQVQIAQSGFVAQSDDVNYNLKTQEADFSNSFYISEIQHAHGEAKKIVRPSTEQLILEDATYTTCPPEEKPTWELKAKEIKLNQETGRGETVNARLYVKDVPILALPYFNFPIDDRRTTGLLTPSFGLTNTGGAEINAPVYLNLAPNYDAILTPRYFSKRGLMLDGEFRFLTAIGQGKIDSAYLNADHDYNNETRKALHFDYLWQMTPQFSASAEYNYASDKDYFSDFQSEMDSRTDLNLRRAINLNYANGIPGLTAQLKVESFQTLDSQISRTDRPYSRLPQFLVNYQTGNPDSFQFEFNNDSAYFKKNLDDAIYNPNNLTVEPNGTRIYNNLTARYNFNNSWSYVHPSLSLRNLNFFYDQDTKNLYTQNTNKNSENSSITVPEFTLDSAITFQKEGKYLQTLSPRLFYAYAPYREQNDKPNFDSVTAALNYDQLFSPRRFYGHDRLEDNNFASVGLSYSLFDTIGLERLRASVGQSFFFSDRRVTLNENTRTGFDTDKRTGPVITLASQINQNFNLNASSYWLQNGDNAQHNLNAIYTTDQGSLYSLGYFYSKEIANQQQRYDQVTGSFVQPINNNWRILGHAQYDIKNKVGRDYLLGINYESCCWGLSLYARSYYNDLDNINDPNTKAQRGIMAEITLKGLGQVNNKFASLLKNRVLGFNQVNQYWTER